MICKNCGTEIADKALICYRCGQATFEAQRKAPDLARRRPGSLIVTVALTVLLLGALFLGQVTTEDGAPEIVRWTIGGLAAIVLVWRIVTGRTTGRRKRPGRR